MFLRVASDPQDRHRIHPHLLGVFLGKKPRNSRCRMEASRPKLMSAIFMVA
jgi:hypothetical protein